MRWLALSCAVALTGCTRTISQADYDPTGSAALARYAVPARYAEIEQLDDPSLFASDTEVLSDSAIRRILDFNLVLPDTVRVAVLQLSERFLERARWSAPAAWPSSAPDRLLAALEASPRVRHASRLPALLVPRQRTVGYLREAAARYQADLLVAYRTDCQAVTRQRFLMTDEVRATCAAEAALIDTRTGIVPFTVTAAREFEAKKTKDDVTFQETVRRAELTATGDALAEVGERVAGFLAGAH